MKHNSIVRNNLFVEFSVFQKVTKYLRFYTKFWFFFLWFCNMSYLTQYSQNVISAYNPVFFLKGKINNSRCQGLKVLALSFISMMIYFQKWKIRIKW